MYLRGLDESVVAVGSLVVCFAIGAYIGDLIGKARHYKGPRQYQP